MYKRIITIVLAVVLVLMLAFSLMGCESYSQDKLSTVGDAGAAVVSNGGLAVQQGDYLYFVNGYSGYLTDKGKDNWFGNVVKGAIVRVSIGADGTIGEDYVTVVPKSVMASSEGVGFSIFGNYIYYVSPSSAEDRSGKVNTDTLQFMRTKINGTGTQVILNLKNNDVKYKYTKDALIYFNDEDGKLYSKSLSSKKFKKSDKGNVIAEKVSSVYFPNNSYYDPNAEAGYIGEYVFFTKASDVDYEYSNTVYVASPRGSFKKVVIGEDSYTSGKYGINILSSSVTDGKLAIYYTKTAYSGTDSTGTVEGTYAYEFADNTFAFDSANEKLLSSQTLKSLYPMGFSEGIISYGSTNLTVFYTDGTAPTVYEGFSATDVWAVYGGKIYYVNNSTQLLCYSMDNTANAELLVSGTVLNTFTRPDVINGYMYYIFNDNYKYTYRMKMGSYNIADTSAFVNGRIGIVTDADQKAMDKAAEEEK